ncbi:MAG: hypothetical protein KC621_15590 [Myxococcales bacterium]|nr:hypothetical protein [Myxococcales bacterium]
MALGDAVTDRECLPCRAGYYSVGVNSTRCERSELCAAGTELTQPGTSSAPPVCAACDAGTYCAGGSATAVSCGSVDDTWDRDGDPASACEARRQCAGGYAVVDDGNATTNRTCQVCAQGTFAVGPNATMCSAWTECPAPDTIQAYAPTQFRDRVCIDTPWDRVDVLGTAHRDHASSLVVLPDGSMRLGGTIEEGAYPGFTHLGMSDAAVVATGPDGVVTWADQFGTASFDAVDALAVGPLGTVYVAGDVHTAPLPGQVANGVDDVFVRKYSSAGAVLWTRQFGTSTSDYVYDIAVGPTGDVWIVGRTYGVLPGQTAVDAPDTFVRVYDTDGNERWTRQMGFGNAGGDSAYGVVVDAAGAAYITGELPGATVLAGQPHLGAGDAYLLKLDTDGTTLWERQFGTDGNDVGVAVVLTSDGDIVALSTRAGTPRAITLVRYAPDGTLLHTYTDPDTAGGRNMRMAPDLAGGVVISGTSSQAPVTGGTVPGGFVQWYDDGETLTRTVQFAVDWFAPRDIAVDAEGRVRVLGAVDGAVPHETGLGREDIYVLRLLP